MRMWALVTWFNEFNLSSLELVDDSKGSWALLRFVGLQCLAGAGVYLIFECSSMFILLDVGLSE